MRNLVRIRFFKNTFSHCERSEAVSAVMRRLLGRAKNARLAMTDTSGLKYAKKQGIPRIDPEVKVKELVYVLFHPP